jgi:hypothetical protein
MISYRCPVGVVAGRTEKDGYFRVTYNGVHYYAHRIIWLMQTGDFPKEEIDHVDGNRTNNRLENLREANSRQNKLNTRRQREGKARYTHYWRKTGKWHAVTPKIKGKKRQYLGSYETMAEASAVAEAWLSQHMPELRPSMSPELSLSLTPSRSPELCA